MTNIDLSEVLATIVFETASANKTLIAQIDKNVEDLGADDEIVIPVTVLVALATQLGLTDSLMRNLYETNCQFTDGIEAIMNATKE